MKRIDFENKPSKKTPMSAQVFNKLQDNIEEAIKDRSIITVGIDSTLTISDTQYIPLSLNTIVAQKGNKLSLEDGKVKIGSGVNYVIISSNVMFNTGYNVGDKLATAIQNNGTNVGVTGDNATTTKPYITLNYAQKLIPVVEGDLISLAVRNETGARGTVERQDSATNLTVEVI